MGKDNAGEGRLDRAREVYAVWSNRFKLDSHHTIERFGVISAIFVLIGVMVLGCGAYGAWEASKGKLGATALYTKEFTTSRTGVKGVVDGVWRSENGKRAMVMMHFSDPAQMSSDPNDYYVYGVGVDGGPGGGPTKVDRAMAGSLYSFGQTGYLAVVLDAPDGFPQQIVNLTIRAKKELVTPLNDPAKAKGAGDMDRSFLENDQWRVMVNPGAKGIRTLAALDSQKAPQARALFADAVIFSQEQQLRVKLDGQMAKMKTYLDRIGNYVDAMATTPVRMGKDGDVRLLPPSVPEEINGDSIDGLDAVALRKKLATVPADQIPGIAEKTPRARLLDTFSDGYMVNTFVLHQSKTMPAGVDFDWRSRSVSEGYLEHLTKPGQTPEEFMSELAAQPASALSTKDLRWPLSNGKTINDVEATDFSTKPLIDLRNKAMESYKAYYEAKRTYQTSMLIDLLRLEQTLDSIGEGSGSHSGPGAVEFRL